MEIPKYHETFIPILETLNTTGAISSRDLASQVLQNYYSNLPQELLNKKTSSGANILRAPLKTLVTLRGSQKR